MSLRHRLIPVAAVVAVVVSTPAAPASAREVVENVPAAHPLITFPSDAGPEFDPHTVLVKFKPGSAQTARAQALATRKAAIARTVPAAGFVKVTTAGSAEAALASLREDPSVAAVSLDYKRHLTATPSDTDYPLNQQTYLNTVRLPRAWDVIRDASSQVIAVVDTGVHLTHTDLAARIVPGYNVLNPGSAPTDWDPNDPAATNGGHGTMVAGIAAAHTNNARGIAGAAWTSKIMPVKVFPATGGAADSDIATGVTWAADHGATIINLSLGGPRDGEVIHAAIQYATSKGALVVAAAGNDSSGTAQYPAAYPEVLTVSSTDWAGALADFSSHGDWVDVAAPGYKIISTVPPMRFPDGTLGDYAVASGSSFAAPMVSGIAALVRAKFPTLTPAQVIARVRETAQDAGPRGFDPYFGAGVADASRAVAGPYGAEFPQPSMGAGEPNDVPARATPAKALTAATFGAEGDVDWYRFDMTSTSPMAIRVRGPKFDLNRSQNADPVLELYDQDLRLLGRSDNAGWDAFENVTTSLSPGTHYVAVRNFNGAIDSRPYELEIAADGLPVAAAVPGEQAWVRNIAPADFATGQAQSIAPAVTFQRALDPASVTASAVQLLRGTDSTPVDATVAYDTASKTVTLTPKAPLTDNTPYRIVAGAVKDVGGAVNAVPFTTTFRTVNTAPPAITGFTVTGGRDGIATLTWDPTRISDLDAQTVRMAAGTTPPATTTSGTAIYNGTSATVKSPVLTSGTAYSFRIWVKDRTGKLSSPADVILRSPKLTTSGVPASITAGAGITAALKTELVGGGPLASAEVVFQARGFNGTWATVATVTTDGQGLASAPHSPAAYTEYRWQYRGGPGSGPATSAVTTLGVRALISGSASAASVRLGSPVVISGSVSPVKTGKPIELQRLNGAAWVRVAGGTVAASGIYKFTVTPTARGTVTYRVAIPADTSHLASASAAIPVSVT